MSSNLRLGVSTVRRDPGQTFMPNEVNAPSKSRSSSTTGADSLEHGWGPLDTFSSNKNDRRGAAGLSKIAQIDEIRIASGRAWTKGRLAKSDLKKGR